MNTIERSVLIRNLERVLEAVKGSDREVGCDDLRVIAKEMGWSLEWDNEGQVIFYTGWSEE